MNRGEHPTRRSKLDVSEERLQDGTACFPQPDSLVTARYLLPVPTCLGKDLIPARLFSARYSLSSAPPPQQSVSKRTSFQFARRRVDTLRCCDDLLESTIHVIQQEIVPTRRLRHSATRNSHVIGRSRSPAQSCDFLAR